GGDGSGMVRRRPPLARARRPALVDQRHDLWHFPLSGDERHCPADPLWIAFSARGYRESRRAFPSPHLPRRLADRLVRAQQGDPFMLIFYGHPFSSYTSKALIALYEKDIPFEYRSVDPEFPSHMPELKAHWPVGQFPLIVHDGTPIFESSIIIEYLDHLVPEPKMVPAAFEPALRVRFLDRIFDLHVMNKMQAVVADALRGP